METNKESIIGKRFNKLLVIGKVEKRYLVKCDCGNERILTKKSLKSYKSCGCEQYKGLILGTGVASKLAKQHPLENLEGKRFGRLLVIKLFSRDLDKRHRSYWWVKCDCGKEFYARQDSLKHQDVLSCGCLLKDKNKSRALPDNLAAKHNYYASIEHSAIKRNLKFDLSFEQVMQIISKNCFYCGQPPTDVNKFKFYRNGIDRKENNIGYEESNCVACCAVCNRAKSDMPYNDWLEYITNLSKYKSSMEK